MTPFGLQNYNNYTGLDCKGGSASGLSETIVFNIVITALPLTGCHAVLIDLMA